MEDLAAAKVRGLWLEKIEFGSHGEALLITLEGKTQHPDKVPELLKALTRQEAFAGHRFTEIVIDREEVPLSFSVGTSPKGVRS